MNTINNLILAIVFCWVLIWAAHEIKNRFTLFMLRREVDRILKRMFKENVITEEELIFLKKDDYALLKKYNN